MNQGVVDASSIRAQLRENEQDARRLIARAAYMEKRAQRVREDSPERLSLTMIALELRAAAERRLAEASELSRKVVAVSAIRP